MAVYRNLSSNALVDAFRWADNDIETLYEDMRYAGVPPYCIKRRFLPSRGIDHLEVVTRQGGHELVMGLEDVLVIQRDELTSWWVTPKDYFENTHEPAYGTQAGKGR